LCLLSSTAETGGKIRDLKGVDIIMKLLPSQFPEKRGEATPHETLTLYNKNLRLTLRTLRHLTEPDMSYLHYPRLDTAANLRRVFDTLQVWMADETSKGLTLQVLYNMSRVPDETGDPTQQDTPTLLDPNSDIHPNWNSMRNDRTGYTGTSPSLPLQTGNGIPQDRTDHPEPTTPTLATPHGPGARNGNPSSPFNTRILPRRDDAGEPRTKVVPLLFGHTLRLILLN